MQKIIGAVFLTIITSFYFFPFEFVFLPGINTKMALAGIGLVILGFRLAKRKQSTFDSDITTISVYALMVSFCGLISVTLNNTYDFSYTTYFISMWVWLSGAYTVSLCIKQVHGHLSFHLIAHYLIAVSSAQCLLALSMSLYEPLQAFVDGFLGSNEAAMGIAEGRMYGIGCALDVAGLRFSATLVLIAYLCSNNRTHAEHNHINIYLICFMIIAIIGNMIARTTIVGVILAMLYWIFTSGITKLRWDKTQNILWRKLLIVAIIVIPILVLLYHTSPTIHKSLRFGFEGFFSLAEKGHWEVGSNETLKNMVVFPDNLKTWLIGDGYMIDPTGIDPYYIGPSFYGYYQATDIGYLRFIFYFGILGTIAFITFMCKITHICHKRLPLYPTLFSLLLLVNLIGWLKVATDIFSIFAIFLMLNPESSIIERKNDEFIPEA